MLASIDIGSNTVRLLLGSVEKHKVIPHLYVRRITRLKGGQTKDGLTSEAIDRTLSVLSEFAGIIDLHEIKDVRIVGTEALRSAPNRQQVVSRVLDETGLRLDIISGEEEAFLAATGVCSVFDATADACSLVFDIGGGSTEFILLLKGEIVFHKSCQLGVVDLTESLPHPENRHDFIAATISLILSMVEPVLRQYGLPLEDVTLVGTAGTVTTLAAMDMQMIEYDWRQVNGYTIEYGAIEAIYDRLICLSVMEREMLPGMEKGRGDLIPAGIEITLEIIKQFRSEKMTVSDFGLLEGVLLSMSSMSCSND